MTKFFLNDSDVNYDFLKERLFTDKNPTETAKLFVSELKDLNINTENKFKILKLFIENQTKQQADNKLVSLADESLLLKLNYHSRFLEQLSESKAELQLESQLEQHIKDIKHPEYVDLERFIKAKDQVDKIIDCQSPKTLAQRIKEMELNGYEVIDKGILNSDVIGKLIKIQGSEKAAELVASKIVNLTEVNSDPHPNITYLGDIQSNLKIIEILNPTKLFMDQLNISTSELAAKKHIQIVNNEELPKATEEALAVQNYISVEKDPKKREDFANKQLQKYCNKQDITTLNEDSTKRISKGIVDILTPVCKNDQEKESLKKNAAPLVRECAKKAGIKMSFGEAWKAYIIDPIKKLFGRKSSMEKLIKENSKIIESFKKNINPVNIAIGNSTLPNKKTHELRFAK